MHQDSRKVQRPQIFLFLAAIGIWAAIIGFAKTFFLPLLSGTFSAPLLIYVHGAILFGWVFFFAAQSLWIHRRDIRLHRRMGWLGAGLAAGVVISTLGVGHLASLRTAAAGNIDLANREFLVIVLEMAAFAAIIGAAFALRRRTDIHKRLMLLALIASLGPAWFRFRHYFPAVENPIFLFSLLIADSLIVIAAVADFLRERRVHPVYLTVGPAMVGLHLIEVFAFGSEGFGAVAAVIAGPFI